MKIFVSGANGALGREMTDVLTREGLAFLAVDIDRFDITDFKTTRDVLIDYKPDVILHFAAVSDVDRCEEDPENALRVNSLSSLSLGIIASKIRARLLYTSTNFVFDGSEQKPYGEQDEPNPINAYGRTKLLGENYIRDVCARHFIVRTSWLFGRYSKNFISRFLNRREKPGAIDAVCDRFASFTYTLDLAEALLLIIRAEKYGIFHVVNNGVASFKGFLQKAKEIMGFETEIKSIKAESLNLPAPRPKYSPLRSDNYEAVTNQTMRSWEDALTSFAGGQP